MSVRPRPPQFDNGRQDTAIEIAEELLLTSPALTLGKLAGLEGTLRRDKPLMSRIITRWLTRGELALCTAAHDIAGTNPLEGQTLELDPKELKTLDVQEAKFLAHKIIGYFFFQPISAASLLLSLMKNTSDEAIQSGLGQLLFDPLLVNYTGKLRLYLKQRSESETGKVKDIVVAAVKAIDDYLATLNTVGNLPALRATEAQREAYKRHMSVSMAESYRAAEKNSALLSIIGKSTLLYGKTSIYRVFAPDGQSHRMEMPMHSFGVEFEIPRMEVIDPAGLNFMLNAFRAEGRSS